MKEQLIKLEEKLKKYATLITIVLAVVSLISGMFIGKGYVYYYGDYTDIKNNKNCIVDSPNSKIVGGDESTTVNVDGPVTTSQLTIGSGGRLNIGTEPKYFKPFPLGIYHDNPVLYRNVLINSTWGLSFVEFFPPKTWINFGLCNEDKSDCLLYSAFEYNESVVPCNYIQYSNNESFLIEPRVC